MDTNILTVFSTTEKPFADQFDQKIEREFCEGSAIAPHLYRSAVEIIEDTGFWEPNLELGQSVPRFWETRKPHNFRAIAMLRHETGKYWQGKPQNPRTGKDGKLIKYETLASSGSRAYLPAVDAATRQAIARRYGCDVPLEGSFWDWVASRPNIPIILTEGGKKALALLSLGCVAIALTGVNGGYRANQRIGGAVVPLERKTLIDDLKRFTADRSVILAFDQDAKPETQKRVKSALFVFSGLLKAAGARVAIAEWQPGQGKGIDDLIVNCGSAAAETAIGSATEFGRWAIRQSLENRVSRRPDLNIGEREFSVDGLPDECDIALWGGKGTRKSKTIGELIGGSTWLSICALQAFAREQAEGFGGGFINDDSRYGNRFLRRGDQVIGGCVCVPSVLKVQAIDAKILVIDETTDVLYFLLVSKLANKDGIRPLLLAEFERRIREADRIIIADADLTEEALLWIEAIRGKRFFLVRSDRRPLQWQANIIQGMKKDAIADLMQQIEEAGPDKVVYASFDEKATANAIAAVLEAKDIHCLLITQETSGGVIERSFLNSKGADLPALIQSGVRAILASPTVTKGFSIEHYTDLVDAVWGIYTGCSITADAIAQALDRVRALVPRFIYVPEKGKAYSKISKALNTQEFIRDFKASSTAAARLARLSLKPETAFAVDSIDWQSANFKLLASFEVNRNKGMKSLRDVVIELLAAEGKVINWIKPSCTKEQAQSVRLQIAEARSAGDTAREIAIASALDLNQIEFEALEKKSKTEPLAQSETEAVEKYRIAKFYRVEGVDSALVRFDNKGRRRSQARNFETWMCAAIAQARTVNSIELAPSCPQDWKRDILQHKLLMASGAVEFILGIMSGDISELLPEMVIPIGEKLKTYAVEFKLAFNYEIAKITPQQAVYQLMDWAGLKRDCKMVRTGKMLERRYWVEAENLAAMLDTVTRRAESVTPSQSDLSNSPGVTSPHDDPRWQDEAAIADIRQMIAACPAENMADLRAMFPDLIWKRAIAA